LPDLGAGPFVPGDEYRSVDAVLDRYISGAEMNDGTSFNAERAGDGGLPVPVAEPTC
jgi:hypothetical protein